ncbi:MAG: molybdopterin-dependent oxidoreductase, partial [Oscillospiraceae bacterium]|nr:molybdopterin-dependent oxidoreductase [Oscillospiraceae bacterium]
YVLGKEDGVPKTPAWASPKCGVPEWTIKALARDWALKVTSLVHGNGGPGIRGPYATEPARLEAILLGMRALGAPGVHQAKMIEWQIHTPTYPLPYQAEREIGRPVFAEICRSAGELGKGNAGQFNLPKQTAERYPRLAEILKPMETPPAQSLPKCMIHDAILKDNIEWYGLDKFIGPREEQFHHHKFPEDGCSRIHMIWTDSPCMVTCWNDGYRFVRALRSEEIECVVAQHPWLENDCILADIVLPITTKVEQNDVTEDTIGGTYIAVYRERPACPPEGESVTDFEAVCRVAKKLGGDYYERYTVGTTEDELIREFYNAFNVTDLCGYEEFEKKEIVLVPPDPDIQIKVKPGLREFYEDPKKMPLKTPTGLLEFTSTELSEYFPDDKERPPYPKWIENSELHDERLSSPRAEKYPLLCVSNHGRWRMHSQCDDITWTREVDTMKIRAKDGYLYEPCWIHTSTANKRGIRYGDIVKVFNERGTVLAAAYVTERLIPGACYMDHGARFDPIDAEKLDRGGAINLITPTAITSKNATGMVVSGFLVDVQKVTDEEIKLWKRDHPEAYARKTDEAAGVCREGWLINSGIPSQD